MALTFATADAVLKEDYHGPVQDQLNNSNIFLAQVNKNTEDFVGRRFITPLHTSRNTGVGARAENATLPTAGNQGYRDVIGPVRSMYARIQLTGQTIEAMKSDRGSFIRALSPEMSGATDDAARDYCRQLWGTSNGQIAVCGTTTASTTVQLAATTPVSAVLQLMDGFLVDIGTAPATPGTVATNRVVLDGDTVNKTILISGAAVTTSSSNQVYRAGAGGSSNNSGNPGDGQIELTGLQTMISTSTTLHTLAVATEPRWKAQVYANGGTGRNISENLVTTAVMDSNVRSGRTIDLMLAAPGAFRSYTNLLTSLKRLMNTIELKGGYTAVGISTVGAGNGKGGITGLALQWDRDCPDKSIYGLDSSSFKLFELLDWEWMDKAGAILVQVPDTDAYSATLKKYAEFVCQRRNSNWVIQDINES
jgi:hypothetical protein